MTSIDHGGKKFNDIISPMPNPPSDKHKPPMVIVSPMPNLGGG